jgi:NADH-quinone oxidoreductase subunit J
MLNWLNISRKDSWAWYVIFFLTIFVLLYSLIRYSLWFFFVHSAAAHDTALFYFRFYIYVVPTLPILLSVAVILANNPIFSLFFLISLFFSSVLLLFSLQIEFLAMIYLIIYIGAISILFLFVIMMFNLKQLQRKRNTFFFWSTIFIYFWTMPKFYNLFSTMIKTQQLNNYIVMQKNNPYYLLMDQKFDILIFSELFYTYYSYLFLLSGMILLSAMLGSIVLALSTVEN